MSCRHSKTTSQGLPATEHGWVHGKVKNYVFCVQTPNSRTHGFMEQEAKQLTLMTELKERENQERFSWERSSEGNFITRS